MGLSVGDRHLARACGTGLQVVRLRSALAAGMFGLLFLGSTGMISVCHAQTEEPEAPDAPVSPAATGEGARSTGEVPELEGHRPAFVLPDVVVAGEDQSRLAGGMRILDAEMPGISPQQRPLVIDPGPTHYLRRRALPFSVPLPAAAPVRRVWGFLRLGASEGPGGVFSFAAAPGALGRHLLWADLWREQDRVPDRASGRADFGWRWVDSARSPAWRIALDARADHRDWQTASQAVLEGEFRDLRGRASIARAVGLAGAPTTLRLLLSGGDAATDYWIPRGDQWRRMRASASWSGLTLQLATSSTPRDLRDPQVRDGWVFDLEAGYLRRDPPYEARRGATRWRGTLAWRVKLPGGVMDLGVAGGGEVDEGDPGDEDGRAGNTGRIVAPHLAYRHLWRPQRTLLLVEFTPRVTFAGEIEPRGEGPRTIARELGRDLLSAVPQAPAIIDPLLPPERAWPRLGVVLLRQTAAGILQLDAEVAKLHDPPDWRYVSGTASPVLFTSVVGKERSMGRLGVAGDWQLARGLLLRCDYRWSHEAGCEDDCAALHFRPAHELASALHLRAGSLVAELRAHARSSTYGGAAHGRTRGFVTLASRVGVRLGDGCLLLTIDNLLAEEIEMRPDEIIDDRWFGVEWNHTFMTSVP